MNDYNRKVCIRRSGMIQVSGNNRAMIKENLKLLTCFGAKNSDLLIVLT